MYNEDMKLNKLRTTIGNIPFTYRMLTVLMAIVGIALLVTLSIKTKDLANKSKQPIVDTQPGIAFSVYWDQLQQGSNEFLKGTTLYIADIESVNVSNVTRSRGKSAMWQATIVRCEQFLSQSETENSNNGKLFCLGQSAKAILGDPATTGMPASLVIEPEELPFTGAVTKASLITTSASVAEEMANKKANYAYQGNEDYHYKLVVNKDNSKPEWHISKYCSIASQNNNTCNKNSEWTTKIDASTGQLL